MQHSSDEDQKWCHREEDLSWREVDEDVILLDLRSAQYLRLNATGALLWNSLSDGATVADLAKALQQAYSLDAALAATDAAAFVTSCIKNDLLIPCEG